MHYAPRRLATLMLLCSGMTLAAESLAPPHAPLVDGLPVPVTAHPQPLSLLASAVPALATNKRLVHDYWRRVWLGGDAAAVERFLAPDYIEHNPLLPSGRAAFRDWVAANRPRAAAPDAVPDLVSVVAEGPWVVMALVTHYPEPDG